MSRDPCKLRVFGDAHSLVLAIYQHTREFPKDEWFGLRGQMRRAAVSVACNIVEGSARRGTAEYLRFLHMALGSACELKYLASLTAELGLSGGPGWQEITRRCDLVVRELERLTQRMAAALRSEREGQDQARSP